MSTRTIKRKNELMGTKYMTNEGYEVTIIDYENNKNVTIQFENGYVTTAELTVIKGGRVKNPYHPSVYGVGYIGEGEAPISEGNKRTKLYTTWNTMLKRCYDPKFQEKQPTYKGCTVDERWHNFNTFAKWYNENFYQVGDETMALDKDILIKGNKIYGPDTCIFAPSAINVLFTSRTKKYDLPIGVNYKSGNRNKYTARIVNQFTGERKFLGVFETPEEAFEVYKVAKEEYIKQVADHYKDEIPQKLYDAMYKYKVEITD